MKVDRLMMRGKFPWLLNSKVMWARMILDKHETGKTILGRDRAEFGSGREV